MALIDSLVTLTWYPGSPGMTDDPLVLLSTSDQVEAGSPIMGIHEQLVQSVDKARATSAANIVRGNRRERLTWTTYKTVANPATAIETGLAASAGLPTVRGWVKLELTGRDTIWQIEEVVIRAIGHSHDPMKKLLKLEWSIEGGALSIHDEGASPPTIYPDGELLVSTPDPTDRGARLLELAP